VNIGSISGRVATPMMAPYAAGKHAVEAISESLRFEVADQGVQVACVEPGAVATPIWAKGNEQLARIGTELTPEVQQRYADHIDVLRGMIAEGDKGVPPSKVADAVHHALTAGRAKHRYLVGPDAKLVGMVTRLPDRVRAAAIRMQAGQFARKGRAAHTGR
jgi:NAD(P)-dependent dehydrogenase (short-subunit alcohol dehydrogenase family)